MTPPQTLRPADRWLLGLEPGLGFLADMVPIACARACGVAGAGTSLDNSLRIGEPADAEWVLMELDAHVAVGGYGHGHVHLWSPDGRLLATGSQSARLFSIDDFARRRAR
jgi:acyl-CoA thioesterase II